MQKLNLTGVNKHKLPDALSNLSAVLIDGKEVYIDNGAIHGKSALEKGIRFVTDPDDVPNPRRIILVWVTLRKAILGRGIHGIGASVFYIDPEAGVGYKHLADQVNKMDGAIKGRVALEVLTPEEHALLGKFLRGQREELWINATEEVWAQWLTPAEYAPLKAAAAEAAQKRAEIARNAATQTEEYIDHTHGTPPPLHENDHE